VLLVATTLSVYTPRGMTPYGRRKVLEESDTGMRTIRGTVTRAPRWVRAFGVVVVVLVLLFVIKHLTGGGLGGVHIP